MKALRRRSLIFLSLLIGVALLMLYAFFEPAETWWMPRCPINFFTGLECPGCGSQRAMHALLHGEFREAFTQNALLIFAIPFILFIGIVEINRKNWPKLYEKITRPAVIISVLVIITGWTLWRNLCH